MAGCLLDVLVATPSSTQPHVIPAALLSVQAYPAAMPIDATQQMAQEQATRPMI
jgi:hypothetical protein